MDRSVDSPRTQSIVGVLGPGVSVFGLPQINGFTVHTYINIHKLYFFSNLRVAI